MRFRGLRSSDQDLRRTPNARRPSPIPRRAREAGSGTFENWFITCEIDPEPKEPLWTPMSFTTWIELTGVVKFTLADVLFCLRLMVGLPGKLAPVTVSVKLANPVPVTLPLKLRLRSVR